MRTDFIPPRFLFHEYFVALCSDIDRVFPDDAVRRYQLKLRTWSTLRSPVVIKSEDL